MVDNSYGYVFYVTSYELL